MADNKLIAVRFDKELYNKVEQQNMNNSELIRKAVMQFLEGKHDVAVSEKDTIISDGLYNDVYNSLYNQEVTPLKNEIKYLKDKVQLLQTNLVDLKSDKLFLQNEIQALTVLHAAKTPLLSRLKMKLLKKDIEQ